MGLQICTSDPVPGDADGPGDLTLRTTAVESVGCVKAHKTHCGYVNCYVNCFSSADEAQTNKLLSESLVLQ